MTEFQNSIVKIESESRDSLRLKTELENKIKMQRQREEYFKNEIKKAHNQNNEMSSIIESNKRDLEQFGGIKSSLDKYIIISKDSKDFSYSWNSSNKKKFIQTDISGDLKGVNTSKRQEKDLSKVI